MNPSSFRPPSSNPAICSNPSVHACHMFQAFCSHRKILQPNRHAFMVNSVPRDLESPPPLPSQSLPTTPPGTKNKCRRSPWLVPMAEGNDNKTLHQIADAFKDLANAVANSQTAEVKVAPFSQACSLISPLFGSLGIAFKFAEKDYVAKVSHLAEASKSIQTLHSLIDRDVQANSVRTAGSHSRNLLRVKRGLDIVRVLFEKRIVTKNEE